MADMGQMEFNQDWWQREKQKRQKRVLLFLVLLLILIAYFYWISHQGRIGKVGVFDFDTTSHIAFIHQDAQQNTSLYVVRWDGSGLQRVSAEDDKSTKREPAWTMDGKSILYSSNKADGRTSQIWISGGGDVKQLTYGSGNKFVPFVNPQGKRAGFIVQGAVKTVYLNGNEVIQVLPPPVAGSEMSDDPGAIAANADLRGPYLTAQYASDGITLGGVQSISPEENPMTKEGTSLGDQAVRVLPSKVNRALLLDSGHEVSMSWQKDALKLATAYSELDAVDPKGKKTFISGVKIHEIVGDKSKSQDVFITLGFTLEPKNVSLSPDGKKVAFEVWRVKDEGNRELRGIVVMPTDRTFGARTPAEADAATVNLPVIDGAKPQMPRWSPDGAHLLYEVTKLNGQRDLFVVSADLTNPINVTQSLGGDNAQAAWCPIAK